MCYKTDGQTLDGRTDRQIEVFVELLPQLKINEMNENVVNQV